VSTTVPQRFLLTVAETAAKLHVSVKTVRRLIARGGLPALRVSATVRVRWRISKGSLKAARIGPSTRSPIRIDPLELERWLSSGRSEGDG
jgi:excisionase family DNA binding protein